MQLATLANVLLGATWRESRRLLFLKDLVNAKATPTALLLSCQQHGPVWPLPAPVKAALDGVPLEIGTRCLGCARETALLCGRCNCAALCSPECMRAAWKTHRGDCRPGLSVRDVRTLLCTGQGQVYNGALAVFLDFMLHTGIVHRGEQVVAVSLRDVRAQPSREVVIVGPDGSLHRLNHAGDCQDLTCRDPCHEPAHTVCVVTLRSGVEVEVDLTAPQFGDHSLLAWFPFTDSLEPRWPVLRRYPVSLIRHDPELDKAVHAADQFLRRALRQLNLE